MGTLKEQLNSIAPALQEMQMRKEERANQFRTVQVKIQQISAEIAGQSIYNDSLSNIVVNENDLSLKKLDDYKFELQRLQNEKVMAVESHKKEHFYLYQLAGTPFVLSVVLQTERLQKVEKYISSVHKVSAIMGMESSLLVTKIHPSLNELCGIPKNISDEIITKLSSLEKSLEEVKKNRLDKVKKSKQYQCKV